MSAPSVTLTCPNCSTVHTLTGRAPGEPFTCPCGKVLTVPGDAPAPAAAPLQKRRPARLILAVAAFVLVVASGVALLVLLPRYRAYQARSANEEAGRQLYTLCSNVAALHDETGHWSAAGPAPRDVPRGSAVPFPKDATFEKLQFDPGKTRYQYQVLVDGNPDGDAHVRCVARGDLDGDGVLSEATLDIDENGMLRPVRWKDPLE